MRFPSPFGRVGLLPFTVKMLALIPRHSGYNRRGLSSPLIVLAAFCSFALFTIVSFNQGNSTVVSISQLVDVREEYAKVTRVCDLEMPALREIQRNRFQPVEGSETYVYSAYLDRRIHRQHKIRIVAIASLDPSLIHCLIYYANGTVLSTPAEKVMAILDPTLHKNFKYKPHMFYCSENWEKAVKAVSLTVKPCVAGSNLVQVTPITVKEETDVPDSMAVCLRTFHHVRSPYFVLEFIEMQRILGVDHFYIYGLEDISDSVQRVLDYYSSLGLVTVYPWELPVKNSPVFEKPGEIAIHGQYSLINDCLYNTMNRHRQVFMHDLDEYMIPRDPNVRTARQLMKQIHQDETYDKNEKYAGYGFLNCYFCLNKEDYAYLGPQLVTLKRYVRHICTNMELEEAWWKDNEETHTEGGRGAAMKVVIYPTRVILMGVHGVTVPVPGCKRELIIPTDIGVMHHYKKPLDLDCDRTDSTLVDKYMIPLKQRVNDVCSETGLDHIQ